MKLEVLDAPPPPPPPALLLPRWAPWLLLPLLVLPFHPYWVDFEQVRRGLLLLLGGAALLLWPRLPRVRGENAVLVFLGVMFVAAVISVRSLQPWEAVYRIAHWLALLVILRLGAAAPRGFAAPLAVTLAATALFGLLQRLGLAELAGYGVEREPVSVFGNLNVASEWTAVAAMAVAVLGTTRAWLGQTALVLAGAYLVVDQSRSGLIALPIGLGLLALQRRRSGGWVPLALALAGAAVGYGIAETAARPPAEPIVQEAEQKRATATLDVRLEIARSCTTLFGERPVFGWGPGQFQVQYPRVRSQREIELSSHGRQFATEVRTAHDDWLELLVDGGLPLLLVFAAMLFALQRGNRDKARLLPLFVLLLLMFVRAPLGNAPAVVAAMLLAATAPPGQQPWPNSALWATRAVGLLLAVLGLLPVLAHCRFVPYQAAIARGDQPPRDAVTGALAWMWWEPRWLQVLTQEQLTAGELAGARRSAARALQLRPHDPQLYLQLGEVMARGTAYQEAAAMATHALSIDPQHPELRVLQSTARLQQGDVDGAILAVVENPHPALRAQLPNHFRALERLAKQRNDAAGAARCAFERTCLELTETLGDQSPGALEATARHLRDLVVASKDAGRNGKDVRLYALHALHALDLGQAEEAAQFAALVQKGKLKLLPWQRALLGDQLKPLLREQAWVDLLR